MPSKIQPMYPESGLDAAKIQGEAVSVKDPAPGQVLVWDDSTKQYVPASPAQAAAWGTITGTLANQTDLKNVLDGKAPLVHSHDVDDINDFSAQAAASAPVQSINGQTGAVSLDAAAVGADAAGAASAAVAAHAGKTDGTAHSISGVSGLQAALDGKQPSGSYITDLAVTTHAAAAKFTPADGDEFPIADSAASYGLKKTTWLRVRTTMASALAATFASRRVYKTADFTAAAYGRYHTVGTVVVTDPGAPSEGDIFDVVIVSGTANIGGVVYSASRFPIERVYANSAWVTIQPTLTDNLTLNGTANTAPNQTAASGASIITRDLGDARYLSPMETANAIYPMAGLTGGIRQETNGATLSKDLCAISLNNSSAYAAGQYAGYYYMAYEGQCVTVDGSNRKLFGTNYGWMFCGSGLMCREVSNYVRIVIGGATSAAHEIDIGNLAYTGIALETTSDTADHPKCRLVVNTNNGAMTVGSWSSALVGYNAFGFYWLIQKASSCELWGKITPIGSWTLLCSAAAVPSGNITSNRYFSFYKVTVAGATAGTPACQIVRISETFGVAP